MNRLEKVLHRMDENNLEGLLITRDANLRYVSGFTGSESYALISRQGSAFITDSRYIEQAEQECPGFEIVRYRPVPSLEETICHLAEKLAIKRLGFERDDLTFDLYEKISQALPDTAFVPVEGIVEQERRIKDPGEAALVTKAAAIADEAFGHILKYIKIGMTEKEIATELEYMMKKNGADAAAFPTVVASGPRSSLPHALPTGRRIQSGDTITMDFGALFEGYCSDMTRTFFMGTPDEKQREIYFLVKQAQEEGIRSVKAGVHGTEPDLRARNIISAAGYGTYFGHSLGHGVGLEIHEGPYLSPRSEETLAPGNIVTVEPGIYLPDWGGVRIEDTVLVTEKGCEILTRAPKDLIILEA